MKIFTLTFLLLAQFCFLNAQDGILDTSFDSDGIVSTDLNNSEEIPYSVAVQPDGKIIAAGFTTDSSNHFCLLRYHDDGAIDSSFGMNGVVISRFPSGGSIIRAMGLQADGKIVVGGSANPGFALARYLTDGTPDSTFGNTGIITTSIQGNPAVATTLDIQPDGKVLLGGFANNSFVDGSACVVVRYNTDGSLDQTFASGGIAITDVVPGSGLVAVDRIQALKVHGNGKIIAVGFAANDITLIQYNPDGSLDQSFGNGGIITNNTEGSLEGVIVQNDGKAVAAGFQTNGLSDFMLVRYDTSGNLDNTFGTGGIVISPWSPKQDGASSILLQPDQKLLVGGVILEDSVNQFILARYLPNGNPDLTFGTNGAVITKADSFYSAVSSMAFQADGRIVVAGPGYQGATSNFTLARYTSGLVAIDRPVAPLFQVKVYPNPMSEMVTIEYDLRKAGPVSIELLNSMGQQIKLINKNEYQGIGQNAETFRTDGLSQGIYFLSVQTADGEQTFKLVK